VADLGPARLGNATVLERLKFLLEGALREPPRLVSVWASEFYKTLDKPRVPRPRAAWDLEESEDYTVLRVRTADRLGLLCDLVQCLTASGVSIAQALIQTERDAATGQDVALDVYYVTDFEGRKITDLARLEAIQKALAQCL
jgi:UTP:GlnB (protein PII) uridylyltransferase